MNMVLTHGTKSIHDAVADGLLMDVTKEAKEAGLVYPTFMSPALVAKYESQMPGGGLSVKLHFWGALLVDQEHSYYGTIAWGDIECIYEPHEEFGFVMVILEGGKAEAYDLKRTIRGSEYSM